MTEALLPGVLIEIRPEALIVPGAITVGNLGVVGTAGKGPVGVPQLLGSYTDAVARFGAYDRWVDGASGELTLVRALEQAYRFGATTVWAVRVADTNAAAATVDAGGQALMQEAMRAGGLERTLLPSVAAGLAGGPASPMERTSRLNDLEESLR